MRKSYLFLLILLIVIFSPLKSSVRGDYALNIIREISRDEYMGRQAGTLENLKALEFLEKELKKLNLSEIVYQDFSVDVFEYGDIPRLILKSNKKELKSYKYREDFRDRFSGSYEKEGYVRTDVRHINGSFWVAPYDGNVNRNIMIAEIYGAEGIILGLPMNRLDLISQKSMYFLKENLPVVYVSPYVYEEILDLLKIENNLRVYYKIEYKKEIAKAYNLIFYIPSSIKTGKTIALTAHIDHVGRDYDGSFFPGANDNASGVGVLMEIAKELLERGNNYPFNFVFIITNGEEKGLLGSDYFIKNPIIPLKDIVLNINFDCIGRGKEFIVSYNSYAEKIVKTLRLSNDVKLVKDYYINESDQYVFHLYEIPFLFFINVEKDGSIPDLHKKSDTWDRISKENIVFTINNFFRILDKLSLNSL